jgi:hypothetical protein
MQRHNVSFGGSPNPNANMTMRASRPTFPTLPTELWLQILEHATIFEAEHLWTSVRLVSIQFKDYVERLFMAIYLSYFAISLSLPRRDPVSGSLKWPVEIPRYQLAMSFDSIMSDQRYAVFASPSVLKNRLEVKNVEEMRDSNVLPLQRLIEASSWVYTSNHFATGLSMELEKHIEWDQVRRIWAWQIEWKSLVDRFYKMKWAARSKISTTSHRKERPLRRSNRK